MATTNPDLVKEWHTERNGDLRPSDVTAGSGKKVWWHCKLGHEWQAFVYIELAMEEEHVLLVTHAAARLQDRQNLYFTEIWILKYPRVNG